MLVSMDREEQLEIARQVYRRAKAKKNHKVHGILRGSFDQHPLRQQQTLRLPTIANIKEKEHSEGVRSGRSHLQDMKIMKLIKREIAIEQRVYFETISSEQALIVKNSKKVSTPRTHLVNHQTQNDTQPTQGRVPRQQRSLTLSEERMTPPLRVFRGGPRLPLVAKKTIDPQESQYSPWERPQESEEGF